MNRRIKYALILGIQTLLTIVFLTYALYQKAEADAGNELAKEMAIQAISSEKKAIEDRIKLLKELQECENQLKDK